MATNTARKQQTPQQRRKQPTAPLSAPEQRPPQRDEGVSITVPLADELPRSTSRLVHIDVHLRGSHGETMRRLREALNASDVRTADGKHVHSHRDTVRWLMEQIEAGALKQ